MVYLKNLHLLKQTVEGPDTENLLFIVSLHQRHRKAHPMSYSLKVHSKLPRNLHSMNEVQSFAALCLDNGSSSEKKQTKRQLFLHIIPKAVRSGSPEVMPKLLNTAAFLSNNSNQRGENWPSHFPD